MDLRFGSPSQMATGTAAWGLSTIFRIASRMSSATLRPERAAAMRSAIFLAEVNLGLYHVCHFTGAVDVRQLDSDFDVEELFGYVGARCSPYAVDGSDRCLRYAGTGRIVGCRARVYRVGQGALR